MIPKWGQDWATSTQQRKLIAVLRDHRVPLWEQHFKRVDSSIVASIGWDGKGVARVRVRLGACGCTSFSGPPLGQRADA